MPTQLAPASSSSSIQGAVDAARRVANSGWPAGNALPSMLMLSFTAKFRPAKTPLSAPLICVRSTNAFQQSSSEVIKGFVPIKLPVAQSVHCLIFLTTINLDLGAINEMHEW